MIFINREHVIYEMNGTQRPAFWVKEYDTVAVRTYDCYKGKMLPEGSTPDTPCSDELNPATGPIFIEGAHPGDTLKIEILKIEVDELGVIEIDPASGCLASKVQKPVLKRLPVHEKGVVFSEKLRLELKPMIGVIGVAPRGEGVATVTPGTHGGNMDCTQIKEGAVLYLPVQAEGALLSLGDLHACMGDGEIGGCGAEIGGTVTLKLSVLHGEQKKYPVVLTEDKLHIIASSPTIEEAWREAAENMHDYLTTETRLTSDEAVMLQSLAADLVFCQTVNPNKTVRVSIPRYCLEAYEWSMK